MSRVTNYLSLNRKMYSIFMYIRTVFFHLYSSHLRFKPNLIKTVKYSLPTENPHINKRKWKLVYQHMKIISLFKKAKHV